VLESLNGFLSNSGNYNGYSKTPLYFGKNKLTFIKENTFSEKTLKDKIDEKP